jgi:hypothetical protein
MNQTIYFQKAIWEKFGQEEKKSELINHLLKLHYEDGVVKPGSFKAFDNGDVGYTVNPAPKIKKNWCKLHDMDKEFCKGFKH